jgi:hypothetical protein
MRLPLQMAMLVILILTCSFIAANEVRAFSDSSANSGDEAQLRRELSDLRFAANLLHKRFEPILPNSPTFHNFPSQPHYSAINIAFLNAIELALAGYRAIYCDPMSDKEHDPIFVRYFGDGPEDRVIVEDILRGIIGDGQAGPKLCSEPSYPLGVWYGHNTGPEGREEDNICDKDQSLYAIFQNIDWMKEGEIVRKGYWMVSSHIHRGWSTWLM